MDPSRRKIIWLLLVSLAMLLATATSCADGGSKGKQVAPRETGSGETSEVIDAPPGTVTVTPDPAEDIKKGEPMKVRSTAFEDGGIIPEKFSCEGADVSPQLEWDAVEGAKSYAIIADDPDAPGGTWVHWVMWDQPAAEARLSEGVPAGFELPIGARQGMNDFRRNGYGGPCPPPGPAHRYHFKVYALDTVLELPKETTKERLLVAMKTHIIDEGSIMGRFGR